MISQEDGTDREFTHEDKIKTAEKVRKMADDLCELISLLRKSGLEVDVDFMSSYDMSGAEGASASVSIRKTTVTHY